MNANKPTHTSATAIFDDKPDEVEVEVRPAMPYHSDILGVRRKRKKIKISVKVTPALVKKRPWSKKIGVTLARAVIARDGFGCRYCGIVCIDLPAHVKYSGISWPDNLRSIDHIIPRSRGGQSTLENLVIACNRCNRRKGNLSLAEAGLVLLPPLPTVEARMVAASAVWAAASPEARIALVKDPDSPIAAALRDAMRKMRGETP